MAASKTQLTSLTHLGLGIESTDGTAVVATAWVPGMRYRPQDLPQYIPDTGLRGTANQLYGMYLGTKHSTYSLEGMAYPLSLGNFLAAVFGADAITGTTDITHTFTVADTVPSYTLSDTYLGQAGVGRQWPGSKCNRLQLKFTPEAGLSYTASFIGWPSATYTPETTTFETDDFFLGWQGAVTFGGTADAALSSFAVDIQRVGSKPVFSAADTQTPYDIFIGEAKATVQMEFYMSADTEYAYALSEGTETTVVTVTQNASSAKLTLQMTDLQFTKPTINRGQKYVTVELSGEPVYNSTDSGMMEAALLNTITTAYTSQASS